MPTRARAKTPNIPGIGLSRILESANEFVSFLVPPGLAGPPPWPAATTHCPELELPDVKKPAQRFKNLRIPTAELRIVLRAYRERLNDLRTRAIHEYGIICANQSHAMQLQVLSAFSDYWVQARTDLLEQTVDAAAQVVKMAPPGKPRMFNKEFVPMFEYVFGQVEGGLIKRRDKKFLATLSDMEYRQITVWFQNRRARTKKKIQNGQYTQSPPTLEETSAKLRALIAKEDAKSSNQEQVVMTTKRKIIVDVELEDEDEDEEMPVEDSSLDLYNERLSMMFDGDEPPSLDSWAPSRGSFPDPFKMPIYETPSFPPPRWPRAPQLWLPPRVPVGNKDVAEITRRLKKVKITSTAVVEVPVTLTQTMSAATAARCTLTNRVLNSVRSFVPMPRRPKPKVVKKKTEKKDKKDKKDKEMIAPHYNLLVASQDQLNTTQDSIPTTGVAPIINTAEPGAPNAQVQVSGNEDPPVLHGHQDLQVPPPSQDAQMLPPSQGGQVLHNGPASVAPTVQAPASQAPAPQTDQQPPAAQNTPIAPPHNAQAPAPHNAPAVPPAQNPPVVQNGQQAPGVQNPPVAQDAQAPDGTPDPDQDLPDLCDKVSQMEIEVDPFRKRFKYRIPTYSKLWIDFYPEEIENAECGVIVDESGQPIRPFPVGHPLPPLNVPMDDCMDHATMMEVLRMTLRDLNYQGPMPSDDPIVYTYPPIYVGGPVEEHISTLLKPYCAIEEKETMAAMEKALSGKRGDFRFEPVEVPQPPPLPATIADPFPRDFYLDRPSQDVSVDNNGFPLSQFCDSEGIPLPFAPNEPALQMFNNDDIIALPTYDPLYDPPGLAIPFTLYDELSVARPQNQLDEELLVNPFPDSYRFLNMSARNLSPAPEAFAPEPEPQPPAEPEISIYPSYLPQVPLLTKEIVRAATFMHDWLDKAVGIKLKAPSFIDPEAMLQYLA